MKEEGKGIQLKEMDATNNKITEEALLGGPEAST